LADLFADSFAIVAFFEGNPRYVRIFQRKRLVTSSLNVLEVYSTLLRRLPQAEAREKAAAVLELLVDVPAEAAFTAGEFRREMRERKRDCSYIDAWGYAASRYFDLEFLTGDPAFKGIPHVEFVR
jgi:predicted nucleic acid-binding protein